MVTNGSAMLSVRDLTVRLPTREGLVPVVDQLDLQVNEGQIAGIAGESGSGKTVSVMAILGLLPAGSKVTGHVDYSGQDVLNKSDKELSGWRGKEVALVMQDPSSALHPMLRVGEQLTDHVRHHLGLRQSEARSQAIDLLGQVRIPDPRGSFDAYPHQFSGGMRQRIAIAMALACNPRLLIADEPTTGLDVTVQAGILRLLDDLRKRRRLGMILITHDLGVMSSLADTVTVMYAGRAVEVGPTSSVLARPRHPYTAALLNALPHPDQPDVPLVPIAGQLGPLTQRPSGCAFHPRCDYAVANCTRAVPPLVSAGAGRMHACAVDPFGADR